jgi:predicted RNA-binding Zn ribbon-like protein
MANHQVSGHVVPDAVSGHVGLELANTRAGWGTTSPREYLVSFDALAVWAGDVGLLSTTETRAVRRDARASVGRAATVLSSALELRESWYAVATSTAADTRPARADLDVLARAVARAARASRLTPRADGRIVADGGSAATAGLWLPVHRAALAAYEVMATGDVAHVGRCGGLGCGWTFLDPSHRRHWCVMAICGNRAKARAFSDRRRAAAGLP